MAIHLHRSRRPAATLRTSGELFPDGTALELMRDPATGGLTLSWWNGSSLIAKPPFEFDGRTYLPLRLNSRLEKELLLPARLDRHEKTSLLLGELESLFRALYKFTGSGATLLSLLVLASWIPELLPAAACIILHGPFFEATQIMRMLRSLCRRGLLFAEFDRRSLENLPIERLKPTLLVAGLAKDPKTMHLMRLSNARGLFTTRGKTGQDLFSCKAVYVDPGGRLEGALEVCILPAQAARMQSPQELQLLAEQFQPKLLGYRMATVARKFPTHVDPAWSRSPVSGCCQALLSAIYGDDELETRIKLLLAEEAEHANADLAMAPRAILIECALALTHDQTERPIRVKELCEALNAALKGRGEHMQVNEKQVGVYLREAGLPPRELHGVYVLDILEPVRRRIHEVALSLNVPSIRELKIQCPLCEEVWGATAANELSRTLQ
jgi:hypothetical protein